MSEPKCDRCGEKNGPLDGHTSAMCAEVLFCRERRATKERDELGNEAVDLREALRTP